MLRPVYGRLGPGGIVVPVGLAQHLHRAREALEHRYRSLDAPRSYIGNGCRKPPVDCIHTGVLSRLSIGPTAAAGNTSMLM